MTGMSRNSILFVLIAFLLCSCGAGKHLPDRSEQKDSVRVVVKEVTKYIRDTVILEIPAQTAENTTRDTSSHLETDYAESDARINPDGTLFHSLKNKEQDKPIPVDVPVTQKDSIVYRDRYVYETVESPRELTAWQTSSIVLGRITLAGVLIFLVAWLIRRRLKI